MDDASDGRAPAGPGESDRGARAKPTGRVTLADIASAAGVTRMTVSNALNNREGVSAETRDRIRELAGDMGYVTNWVAKKLSDSRNPSDTGIIGVIAEIHTPFMAQVAAAISSAVRDRGRDLLVYSLPEPGKDVPGNVLDLLLHAVDGVISVLPRDTGDLLTLANARVPMVTVDRLCDDTTLPSVGADSYQGACLAMRHLIELGHHRIAFLAGEERRFSARERLRAYRDTMREAGLPVSEDDIVAAGYLGEPGRHAMEELLSHPQRPTAIFAANDVSALGAMEAIDAAGLSVPDDISIVGFDDIPAASQMRPGLTTIRQPYAAMGSAAVDLLFEVKDRRSNQAHGAKQLLLATELVVRGTTAPREF